METQTYRIGLLTLRARRELVSPHGAIPLGGRALDLLSTLAEAGGALVTKDDLYAAVWASSIVEENAIQAQVSAARKALGEEARRLVTVHGRGYRLEIDSPVAAAHTAEADHASIAVLPFENVGNAEHAYLAHGLAEELISRLSRVSGLKVPARTSSFAYRGRAADVRTIAAELGVATVLEGSVRADGERLRVSVQLVDAGSGFNLWAESFDRTMTDLLTLQDELAEAIATALRRELGPRLRETHSSEAMRLVLQARASTRSLTREAMREAVRLAREALALDPGFAKAWESLAGSTFVMGNLGYAPRAAFGEAAGYAEKATELDPGLGGPHAILAGIDAAAGRMVEAAERLEYAYTLEKDEVGFGGHAALSVFLPMGLVSRATELTEACIRLAPARMGPHLVGSLCATMAGDFAQAARHLERALSLGLPAARPPVEIVQSEIAFASGDMVAAAAPLVRLVTREFAVPGAAAAVEAVFAALGGTADRDAAVEAAAALFAAADRAETLWLHPFGAGLIVQWQVRLGALDAAFIWARRIAEHWRQTGRVARGSLNVFWLPDMAPFRRDPRFQDLVRDLDLFRFWERYGPPDGHRLENDKLVVL